MKKLKLFFAACALLLGGSSVSAQQTDVTATYLTNADFSAGTPIDNGVCTYGKDMAGNNTTYYGAQPIDGWTNASVGEEDSGYENCKLAGAIFAYGGTPWLAGSGNTAPATDPEGNAGNAAGLCAVWGGSIQYTQDVTLPAGSYTVVFKVFNTTTGSGNSSGIITTDLFGFKENGGTTHYAPNNTFAIGQWSTVAVTFNLTEETAGQISMGYVGPGGGAAMPHLFVDNVKIYKNEVYEDCTSKVNTTGWSGVNDGYQGGTINTARQYGDKTVGRHIYQTVSGLENGTYEIAIYSISQKEWNGTLANDAGDVAFVVAEGAYELKEWINARSRAGYPGDDNLGRYTISGVKVVDGTMTIGMGLAKADLTEWHHIQIMSLIRTNGADLSDYITAYNNALAAAQAVDQSAKMASAVLSALKGALSTYADDKVDKTSQEALETATEALNTATANANASINSYAIIAAGSIPDNSIEGWTDTGTGSEFRVNTWSTEGNTDGSGMTTPFIQTWINKNSGNLHDGQAYYTLAGLEPGEVYYAQALVRALSELGNTPNGPIFFVNDSEQDMPTAGSPCTNGYYGTLGAQATVGEDGKITLGVKISDANYNWVSFKSVKIQELSAAYNEAVAAAQALEGKISTDAYSALSTEMAGYSAVTVENIEKIYALVDKYSALVTPYAEFNALKEKANTLKAVANDNAEANTTLGNAITEQTAAADAAITAGDIEIATSTLKSAMVTYVGVANPDGNEAKFDCTFMLTNPDLTGFPDKSKAAGWYTDQNGGNSQVMTNESVKGSHGATFFEYWSENAAANDKFALYQKVTLPEGTYAISCDAFASANGVDGATTSAVYFYANDTQGSLVANQTLTASGIEFVNETEQEVKIGLKAMTGNEFRWMGIGYVELYKVPAKAYTVSEDDEWDNSQSGAGDVTLNRTIIVGYNTLVLPFSMTQAEVEANFGTGSVVYELNSFENEVIGFKTADGISPNTPCILKATLAGTSYDIKGRTIVAGDANPTSTVDAVSLIGSYDDEFIVPNNGENFIVSGGKLYFVDSEVKIKGTRAYFNVVGNQAREISFDGEILTGISAVESGEFKKAFTGDIFDLTGRKVKNPSNGIFVVEGKKVVF